MNQPELTSENLQLRSFCLSDANEVQNLAGNFNVSKTTLNIPHPYEPGIAEEWIGTHQESWETMTGVVYAISLLESDQLAGAISLVIIDGKKGELGYWIGEPYWGNGYCTEATKAIIKFSFTLLDLQRVIAEHLASNPASGEVMKKAGMHHIETIQKDDRYGKMADIEVYEIQKT